MWQEIVVGICVLTALLFVLRRYLPTGFMGKKKNAACDGCSGCGDKKGCSSTGTEE
jgi:hypothetical protein